MAAYVSLVPSVHYFKDSWKQMRCGATTAYANTAIKKSVSAAHKGSCCVTNTLSIKL